MSRLHDLIIWKQCYLCKHGRMEAEIKERVMKGRRVKLWVRSLGTEREECAYGREEGLRNSILLPALTYGMENWTWNGTQQSRVQAVEMSYLRGACGVSTRRWNGLSKDSVYERCVMRERGSRVECGMVEWGEKEHPEMIWSCWKDGKWGIR